MSYSNNKLISVAVNLGCIKPREAMGRRDSCEKIGRESIL